MRPRVVPPTPRSPATAGSILVGHLAHTLVMLPLSQRCGFLTQLRRRSDGLPLKYGARAETERDLPFLTHVQLECFT